MNGDNRDCNVESLFGPSYPYVCLTLHGVVVSRAVTNTMGAFGLVAEPSGHPDARHLLCRARCAGSHKRDAVRLFFAAMDMLRLQAAGAAYLYQVSQLHVSLAHAFERDSYPYTPDGIVHEWVAAPTLFAVDLASAMHLRQAGISLALPERRLDLSAEEVQAICNLLVAQGSRVSAGCDETAVDWLGIVATENRNAVCSRLDVCHAEYCASVSPAGVA